MLLFLESELKGLSYVALPCLFPVSYYFRPGSDEVELDILKVGGRRGGGLKSISPSRKTEKAFRLSSPRRPRLCLLNFPILSLFFLNFFFFYHILDRTEWSLTRGYTFSLMCISDSCSWKPFGLSDLNSKFSTVKSHNWHQHCSTQCHSEVLFFRLCILNDPKHQIFWAFLCFLFFFCIRENELLLQLFLDCERMSVHVYLLRQNLNCITS